MSERLICTIKVRCLCLVCVCVAIFLRDGWTDIHQWVAQEWFRQKTKIEKFWGKKKYKEECICQAASFKENAGVVEKVTKSILSAISAHWKTKIHSSHNRHEWKPCKWIGVQVCQGRMLHDERCPVSDWLWRPTLKCGLPKRGNGWDWDPRVWVNDHLREGCWETFLK